VPTFRKRRPPIPSEEIDERSPFERVRDPDTEHTQQCGCHIDERDRFVDDAPVATYRDTIAWVLYTSGELFRVDITNGATPTGVRGIAS
jgi:hypothetical protein